MKKIFCFVNSGRNTQWQMVVALCEDGHCLAQHCSSSERWAKHDIGINSDWKHDNYKGHCPDGYELVWLDNPSGIPEFEAACKKNEELSVLAEKETPTPSTPTI